MIPEAPETPMRDRLRADYAWTPRQRAVLDLLSRGKTNLEIAEQLGISRDGVKYHVGEILSKLSASSREEAAEYWRLHNGLAPRFAQVFRWSVITGVAGRVAAAAAVGGIGVAAGAFILSQRGGDAEQALPEPSAQIVLPTHTPTPTPEPSFVGEINGISIDPGWPGRSALEACPPDGMTLPDAGTFEEVVTASGPLQVDPGRLPLGLATSIELNVFLCKGSPGQVAWLFSIPPNTRNVNPGGGSFFIHRFIGKEPVQQAGPRTRWSEVTIAGHPGVVLSLPNPVGRDTPGCHLTFYDAGTDAMSQVMATTANNDFCIEIARALFE